MKARKQEEKKRKRNGAVRQRLGDKTAEWILKRGTFYFACRTMSCQQGPAADKCMPACGRIIAKG